MAQVTLTITDVDGGAVMEWYTDQEYDREHPTDAQVLAAFIQHHLQQRLDDLGHGDAIRTMCDGGEALN